MKRNGLNGNGHHNDDHMNGHLSDEINEDSYNFNNQHHHHHNHLMNGNGYDKIKIQNQYYTIDSITPDLIKLMNKSEKDIYVNKCRQLYTAIYEL